MVRKAERDIAGDAGNVQRLRVEGKSLLTENRRLYDQITKLVFLQDVARALSSELDLDRLLHRIVDSATELMHATASSLLLVDEARRELVFEIVKGEKSGILHKTRMKISQGIVGWVATHGRPTIVNDASKDPRHFQDIEDVTQFKVTSVICVPLVVKGKTIGVLEVLNKVDGPFNRDDLNWLSALTSQAAIAIDNARLYQSLCEERNKLVSVQEVLRKKLARDLHDGPAQDLSALAMNADVIKKLLDREPERVPGELDALKSLAVRATRDVRNLLFELRPLMLESQGLVPTMQSYAERMRQTDTLAIHLATHGSIERMGVDFETTVFTILQEAISNIKKHASARNTWIDFAWRPRKFVVTIKDDGKGFDLGAVEKDYEKRGSFGLLNMRERTELEDGAFEIVSEPGQGTKIILTFPFVSNRQMPEVQVPVATT